MIIYVIMVRYLCEQLNRSYTQISSIHKTLDSARNQIESLMNENRSDEDIVILGENWSLGEYPCYCVERIEKYYVKHNMMERKEHVEYTIEEYELAE